MAAGTTPAKASPGPLQSGAQNHSKERWWSPQGRQSSFPSRPAAGTPFPDSGGLCPAAHPLILMAMTAKPKARPPPRPHNSLYFKGFLSFNSIHILYITEQPGTDEVTNKGQDGKAITLPGPKSHVSRPLYPPFALFPGMSMSVLVSPR